ncbi:MAG: N-acetyl-alpha-D-glucosaminyl L-malate synthase BshA [Myroides sp.]|jgi:N-acetyl-alpha-D-glucosaminyl L-malate synthase BshA|uniref:N-acetyl-alpha-D-glucosaminyl L-malate synthase BshA n=1 Tax=Myroides marinus TaxID=703342 RepID=A0A164AE39_9FLAO|nr:N-acetyl-alpha-D-glucosaminyl L-malate synthase BshA [Myroides marinus]MDR0193965.1 N-acetyl-alpha-D-glucosaminyl L-malate synthase BshA [Myroides sp.]KZE83632.1 N-acetyl-alpha-D-glucosaminyl L-malate synthase BshA [Myroides marinus]MDM1353681.1 N-acetyl-alpha-D-glucosaminyl L-malate synthase BshA [Myroides marinus]MDM1369850.1 N-acetyl-alpha-D-glucosaminyl L-malate synthase BshA [Myroides marinus]MDM1379428.1 N-acetyl-alpha-D-glucosaminyl L-malate synthase BshA [Myroides marinus]
MKIAIVCYPTFGGSGVVATELGLELAKRNHEVHFITYSQPVRLALLNPNIFYHEVNVPEYPLFHYQPYELALSSKLVDMVKLFKIDVLHVHYAIPHAYAGYMAKQMLKEQGINLPMITTLHGTDITLVGNHPNYKSAVSFSINNSDYVTSVSESLKQSTHCLFGTEKDIHVIPNFIEVKEVDCEDTPCKRSAMASKDEVIITHISNFRKVKRIEDVVSVFYGIQKEMPAKLMLVGDGPEKERAERQAMELGIYDKIIFFGNSNEIEHILSYSDLFLLPSETESFGLAALEAMAMGVPVISSNTGGLPEVNEPGVSGYLSNVGDVEDMVVNALKILKDQDTLCKFKEQAREVAKKFSIDKVVPLYEDIYKAAISKK